MRYSYLTLFAAFILAGCGALVSVFGLGALFAGAGTTVLVMVGGLEFAKLVGTAALHRYWDDISWVFKIPLTFAIVVMMALTSLGIYGFLSDGYQKTASQYEVQVGKTNILDGKSARFANRILDNDKIVISKLKRAETLSDLRAQQEVRLDSLYAKNYINNANKVRKDIEASTEEIRKLNADIDAILVSNSSLADSVNVYTEKILEVEEASTITAELGPLIYLSNLTGLPMDTVVNYLIFVIIGVFDPTAVGLLILASSIVKIEEKKRAGEPVKESKPKRPWFERMKKQFAKADGEAKRNLKPEISEALKEAVESEDMFLPKKYEVFEVKEEREPILIDPESVEIPTGRDEEGSKEAKIDPNNPPKPTIAKKIVAALAKTLAKRKEVEDGEESKSMVDVVIEKEKSKRNFSVDVPDPKPIEAPEATKLGKTWSKKGKC